MSAEIVIYVGTDRSQLLACRVLEYSIRKHTSSDVRFTSLADMKLPEPKDNRNKARTGFSFARFAIPALSDFQGRAIYLDADMLVFKDVEDLWNTPLGEASLACQEELPEHVAETAPRAGEKRKKQCSVMVLDCEKLNWDADNIISGLGKQYSYEELMSDLCILTDAEISLNVPTHWNSLEYYDEATSLIHYTDMMTQPWVEPGNKNGWLWVDALRQMLSDGLIELAAVKLEIAEKYVRPSLMKELQSFKSGPLNDRQIAELRTIDANAGFAAHAALRETPNLMTRVKNRLVHIITG